jgi:transcriptional regulator
MTRGQKYWASLAEARAVRESLCPCSSQQTVAKMMGLTRGAIDQIELKALTKIIKRIRAVEHSIAGTKLATRVYEAASTSANQV